MSALVGYGAAEDEIANKAKRVIAVSLITLGLILLLPIPGWTNTLMEYATNADIISTLQTGITILVYDTIIGSIAIVFIALGLNILK